MKARHYPHIRTIRASKLYFTSIKLAQMFQRLGMFRVSKLVIKISSIL